MLMYSCVPGIISHIAGGAMKVVKLLSLALALALVLASCGISTNAPSEPAVQESLSRGTTASLDFQDEVVYFVFVDRFHDGDPSNNDAGNAELYDATPWTDTRGATSAGLQTGRNTAEATSRA
jgi:hypothetical protein